MSTSIKSVIFISFYLFDVVDRCRDVYIYQECHLHIILSVDVVDRCRDVYIYQECHLHIILSV